MHDYFARMMPDPEKWAEQFAATPVTAAQRVVPAGEPLGDYPLGSTRPFGDLASPRKMSFAEQVRGTAPEPPPDGFLVPPGFTEELMQTLREHFAAMDEWYESNSGPVKPPTRRQRLRSKVSDWREHAARRAYKLIAGYDVPDGEDW